MKKSEELYRTTYARFVLVMGRSLPTDKYWGLLNSIDEFKSPYRNQLMGCVRMHNWAVFAPQAASMLIMTCAWGLVLMPSYIHACVYIAFRCKWANMPWGRWAETFLFVEEKLCYFMNVSCHILGDIPYSCLRLNHCLKGLVHSKLKNLALFILFQTNPIFFFISI